MKNPLIPSLLGLLMQRPGEGVEALSAHDLLTNLADHAAFSMLDPSPQLQLFQKNFLLMNALYQLQTQLWQEESIYLSVSVLKIELYKPATRAAEEEGDRVERIRHELDAVASLRDYYLDWNNFEQTEEDVKKLLNSFWALFEGGEQRQKALNLLGLNESATIHQIKRRYRVLAAQHHPDRGGSTVRFIEIRQAYEILLL